MCVRKFYKGGGVSAVLQVLDRNFEKLLNVLQMLQFIQKWREKNFPFMDPPSNIEGLNVTLAWDYVFFKIKGRSYSEPKCYMFLEFSQEMLIEYQHDNVQIHGHGHEYVYLLV